MLRTGKVSMMVHVARRDNKSRGRQRNRRERERHTSGLVASALADDTLVLEVNVPALLLAGLVLEGEGEDGVGLLDGALALGLVALEDGVDGVERRRGGELVWKRQ